MEYRRHLRSESQCNSILQKGQEGGLSEPGHCCTSVHGKTEQIILVVPIKHVEEKVIRSSQHGLTKGQSHLTNKIASSDRMTSWVDENSAWCLPCLQEDFFKLSPETSI